MSSGQEHEQAPILDSEVVAGLRELGGSDDPGLVAELVDLFLEDAPKYVGEINGGLESGELDRVLRASHTLKSSSANMGAASLSALASSIEFSAKSGNVDLLRELQCAMGGVYQETVDALNGLKH